MRTTVLLLVAGAAVFWAGSTHSQTPVPPKPAEGAQPAAVAGVERPFAHPVYVQSKAGQQIMQVAHVLEKAEVRRLAGRSFVVGTVMKDPPRDLTQKYCVGDTVWVPLDDVAQMIELTPQPKP